MEKYEEKNISKNKNFTTEAIIFIICCVLFTYGEIAGGTFHVVRIMQAIVLPAFAVSGILFGWRTINESRPNCGFWIKITIAIFLGWLFLAKAIFEKIVKK